MKTLICTNAYKGLDYPNKIHLTLMSKLKTRKSAAKRFKATATGKFMRRRAFHNHLLDHKSSKLKRHLSTKAVVDERDADNVRLMIPYA